MNRVRIVRKGVDCYKCNICHSKQNTLRRMCGVWPSEAFNLLSESDQQDFMKKIGDKNSSGIADELEDLAHGRIIVHLSLTQ